MGAGRRRGGAAGGAHLGVEEESNGSRLAGRQRRSGLDLARQQHGIQKSRAVVAGQGWGHGPDPCTRSTGPSAPSGTPQTATIGQTVELSVHQPPVQYTCTPTPVTMAADIATLSQLLQASLDPRQNKQGA